MSEQVETTPAEAKAARAVEDLVAEGLAVTAAAVRERSGVRMATAAAAAKAWKEGNRVDGEAEVLVPEPLEARFRAATQLLWREATTRARTEFDDARMGWEAKLAAAADESAQLTSAVEAVELELEDRAAQLAATTEASRREADELRAAAKAASDQAAEHLAALQAELAAERSRADRAEGALEAVTGERDRLVVQLETLRASASN